MAYVHDPLHVQNPEDLGPKIPLNIFVSLEICPDGPYNAVRIKEALLGCEIPESRISFQSSSTASLYSYDIITGNVLVVIQQRQFKKIVRHLCKTCPGVCLKTIFLEVKRYDGVIGRIERFRKIAKKNHALIAWPFTRGLEPVMVKDMRLLPSNIYSIEPAPAIARALECAGQESKDAATGEARWEKI